MPASHSDRGGRAQTSIDFAVGIGVFLLAVGFVFASVPGMIDPYVGNQEHPIVADRTASQLAEGMFVGPGDPDVLNGTCTYNFFEASYAGDGSDCVTPYSESQSDLTERLNLSGGYSLNVSIRRDGQILFTDGDRVSASPIGTKLALGNSPSDVQSTITARRTASLDGIDVRVVVYVW